MVEPPLQFIIFADVINSCNACLCTIFNNVEPFCSKRLQENVVSDRNWMVATLCMAGINLLFSVTDDISCSLFLNYPGGCRVRPDKEFPPNFSILIMTPPLMKTFDLFKT